LKKLIILVFVLILILVGCEPFSRSIEENDTGTLELSIETGDMFQSIGSQSVIDNRFKNYKLSIVVQQGDVVYEDVLELDNISNTVDVRFNELPEGEWDIGITLIADFVGEDGSEVIKSDVEIASGEGVAEVVKEETTEKSIEIIPHSGDIAITINELPKDEDVEVTIEDESKIFTENGQTAVWKELTSNKLTTAIFQWKGNEVLREQEFIVVPGIQKLIEVEHFNLVDGDLVLTVLWDFPPLTPENISTEQVEEGFNISWENEGYSNIILKREINRDDYWQRVGEVIETESEFYYDAEWGIEYQFAIVAKNSGGFVSDFGKTDIVELIEDETVNITGSLSIQHNFPESKVETSQKSINQFDNRMGTMDELIVRYHYGEKSNAISSLEDAGFNIIDELDELNAILVEGEEIQSASKLEEVRHVEQNKRVSTFDYIIPDDPKYEDQWVSGVMRLPQTWRDNQGGDTRVAVLDTGVDYNHIELEKFVDHDASINLTDDEGDYMDEHGHGTHVAGSVGAEANNQAGIAGVLWDWDLMAVQVLTKSGSGTYYGIAKGILYASNLLDEHEVVPADIINMSLGGSGYSETLHDAVKEVNHAGVLMIAAAGNTYDDNVSYPAKFPEVVAVSALEYVEGEPPTLASFSSYGDEIDLAAPGRDVLSTYPGDYVSRLSGTSMASPQVAGLAGLLIANGVPPRDVLETMQRTAIDLGDEYYYGAGMINTYWATQDVNEIKIIVGERLDRNFEIIEEIEVPIDADKFEIEAPTGEYEVMAWIDVRGSGHLENGDYFKSSGEISVQDNININIELEEYYQ